MQLNPAPFQMNSQQVNILIARTIRRIAGRSVLRLEYKEPTTFVYNPKHWKDEKPRRVPPVIDAQCERVYFGLFLTHPNIDLVNNTLSKLRNRGKDHIGGLENDRETQSKNPYASSVGRLMWNTPKNSHLAALYSLLSWRASDISAFLVVDIQTSTTFRDRFSKIMNMRDDMVSEHVYHSLGKMILKGSSIKYSKSGKTELQEAYEALMNELYSEIFQDSLWLGRELMVHDKETNPSPLTALLLTTSDPELCSKTVIFNRQLRAKEIYTKGVNGSLILYTDDSQIGIGSIIKIKKPADQEKVFNDDLTSLTLLRTLFLHHEIDHQKLISLITHARQLLNRSITHRLNPISGWKEISKYLQIKLMHVFIKQRLEDYQKALNPSMFEFVLGLNTLAEYKHEDGTNLLKGFKREFIQRVEWSKQNLKEFDPLFAPMDDFFKFRATLTQQRIALLIAIMAILIAVLRPLA